MVDRQSFFDPPVRNDLITYDVFEKLQQIKQMIMQLVVCYAVIIF